MRSARQRHARRGYATVVRRLGWLVNVSNDRETVAAARKDRKYLQNHYR